MWGPAGVFCCLMQLGDVLGWVLQVLVGAAGCGIAQDVATAIDAAGSGWADGQITLTCGTKRCSAASMVPK